MDYPYVGEIKMFAGKFAPDGWLFCDGTLLPIAENHFLYNVLGTIYGGDGQVTFGLPDFRGHLPIHQDEGPGAGERPFNNSEPYLYVNYIISLYGVYSPRN
ncbi:phage tail protein [Dyadobacter sp. CY326]|uniref:phage tail protein n=1 Tax=Dyadobacter sp. CY326 TaxID=2907300 RepID=UPI001F16E5F0|nr:tail fiber protein [Dyadobacter sp. CY326]MCE7067130.1 tail fiber protein [Dyadobacter sp. CY326]